MGTVRGADFRACALTHFYPNREQITADQISKRHKTGTVPADSRSGRPRSCADEKTSTQFERRNYNNNDADDERKQKKNQLRSMRNSPVIVYVRTWRKRGYLSVLSSGPRPLIFCLAYLGTRRVYPDEHLVPFEVVLAHLSGNLASVVRDETLLVRHELQT